MSEASRLVDAAGIWRDQVVARFAEAAVALPPKQFTANSPTEGLSFDDEMLAVAVQRIYVGTAAAEGDPGSGSYFPLVADLALVLLRCIPTSSSQKGVTAERLQESAEALLTDLSLIASATNRAAVADAWGCERIRIGGGELLQPSGGVGGVTYRLTLSV